MVPDGWFKKKLSEIADINPQKLGRPESGYVSFIPMDAVSESAKTTRLELKKYEEVSSGYTSFKDNDVLIAKITPCFENGKGALVNGLENGIGFGSTEFHVLRAKKNACPEFIYYVTNTKEFRTRGEMNMQGSAGQKRVTTDYLWHYKIKLPPLKEQQKIAQILSLWDKAIAMTEQLIANSQQQKKALMQQLLTGQKRLLDKNGFRFCGEWKNIALDKLGEVIAGLTYSPSEVTDENGTLVLRSSNIQNGVLTYEDNVYVSRPLPEKSVTRENDILLCVRNGSRALIGKNALLHGKGVGCYHGAFMSIFRAKEPLFIFQLFQSSLFYRAVRRNLGATINSINGSDLKKFTFKIPTEKDERDKIAAVLSAADHEVINLQQKLYVLEQEKKALMQQLLDGKRRVRVDNKEVMS